MRVSIKLGIVLAIICSVFALSSVSAEAACTNINSLPRTISSSGCYTLSQDLSASIASGNGITITANNVELDLGGFSITNTNNNQSLVAGINVNGTNVTIKNGSILNFYEGIRVGMDGGASAIVVDNIRVEYNTAGRRGGSFWGTNVTVSNCQVHGNPSGIDYSGFSGAGPNTRFINNVITNINGANSFDVDGNGGGYGGGLVLDSNVVTNSTLLPGAGIALTGGGNEGIVVIRNIITNKATGIGVGSGTPGGVYRDNLTSGCTTPYDLPPSMINAGNNQ